MSYNFFLTDQFLVENPSFCKRIIIISIKVHKVQIGSNPQNSIKANV